MDSPKLKIFPTGIPGLETILGGGIPEGSLVMLVGAPGTGKTLLLQQMAFATARQKVEENHGESQVPFDPPEESGNISRIQDGTKRRRRASAFKSDGATLYFSTLSEPHDKMLKHIQNFTFFDLELLQSHVKLLSLTSIMQEGLDKISELVVDTARRERARLVIIDSFAPLASLASGPDVLRRFLHQLSSQLGLIGATTFISLERTLSTSVSEDELALADGIIGLYSRMDGARELHRMEVRKMRGMHRLPGLHAYRISNEGLSFYPRLEELVPSELHFQGAGAALLRLGLGLPELEKMLKGGLPLNSSTIVAGSPGMGKTLLSLHYLMEGARRGETGLYIGFQESKEELIHKGDRMGLDLSGAMEKGLLTVLTFTPVQVEPDMVALRIREELAKGKIHRLVMDGYSELERMCVIEGRSQDFTAALVNFLKQAEVTALYTHEIRKILDAELDLSDTPFIRLAENTILLRHFLVENKFQRVISILKMRDSDFDPAIRYFNIQDGAGLKVLDSDKSVDLNLLK